MKLTIRLQTFLLTLLLNFVAYSADAQTYVRYVKPEDLSTKVVYADSVLTSIILPRGISKPADYPKFNAAAYELSEVLKDPSKELLQVWVCGSASPDGLWGYNVKLSQERTDAAASYLKEVLGIPDSMIHKESLNEDWDRLYELVVASDIPCREDVLRIINTKTWGARKTALQKLQNGKVWDILVRDFFPKLRCVRFAIYCKWDQSKPYLTSPEPVIIRDTVFVKEKVPCRDTVYVRDTIVVVKENIVVAPVEATPEQVYEEYREESLKKSRRQIDWLRPHVMAVKTNLLSDAAAIPSLGLEVQLARWLSLDVQGGHGFYNMFNRADREMTCYGVSPELRFWFGEHAMQRGGFLGIHGNCEWYSLAWTDGLSYRNVPKTPAWSVGLTYGYTFCLDKKAHWGLEFLFGAGYGRYLQNTGTRGEDGIITYDETPKFKEHFGLTKVGINLVYRFSLARKK